MTPRPRLLPGLVAIVLGVVAAPAGAAGSGAGPAAKDNPSRGLAVLRQAVAASQQQEFEGRMVIVTAGDGGSTVSEVDVARAAGGDLRVGSGQSWVIGRDDDAGYLFQAEAGRLLSLGPIDREPFSLDRLLAKYVVRLVGTEQLGTGSATVVAVRERGRDHARERLFVDRETGLVVRRETFDAGGAPQRVIAFTSLDLTAPTMAPPPQAPVERRSPEAVPAAALSRLGGAGWVAPSQLPRGFRLERGYARDDHTTLHLVYSDGLYTLSVYEEVGRLDDDAVAGAVRTSRHGTHVWHWPGAQPLTMVWTGNGMTFTAVSDAPWGQALAAISAFPSEGARGMPERLWHGVRRVSSWLWPFG